MECDDLRCRPIDELNWVKDACHPRPRLDGKTTCETLWVAQSHSGDYHDNMTSSIFMLWVQEKLIPTFETLHPDKVMVLVADNAPYHHSRPIGSLASLTKCEVVQLMVKHGVDYVDLPMTSSSRIELASEEDDLEDLGVEDLEDRLRIKFDPVHQVQRACLKKPTVGSLEELKISLITYLKTNKPELLECRVETMLGERGHQVLWTPPYCPELQPIELFWAAGKNHVALCHKRDTKMRDVVESLREGWYGNGDKYKDTHPLFKRPVDCSKLWDTSLEIATTKFVALCDGISGVMGDLVVDEDYVDEEVSLPIDTLVCHMTRGDDNGA